MAFIAQLLGAIMGAAAGFGLGEMLVVGIDDQAIDMRYIMAGFGALIGFVIGRSIASRYEREVTSKSNAKDE